MIFLTVGTQFPFDRLVKEVDNAMDRGLVGDEIFAQIGQSSYQPRNFPAVSSLDKHAFDDKFRQASAIISHAGMGSITMAMEYQKPMLVMPRCKKFHEVVNDHQISIAKEYEKSGYILVAYTEDELADKLAELKTFVPKKRVTQPEAVARRIKDYLNSLS